jgi:tyrosine-protein kinase Etk/Wzc
MPVKENTIQPIMHNQQADNADSDEIDLSALFGNLVDRKLFIVLITALFALIGIAIAVLSEPIYNATAMLQVEENSPSVPGLDDMASMFESTSEAVTEIELLKSRSVLGEAIDKLKLDIVAEPKLLPLIGGYFYRNYTPSSADQLAEPIFDLSSYAWGGETIDVFRFEVPQGLIGQNFELVAGENQNFTLLNANGEQVISGRVGTELSNNLYQITVRKLNARPGTRFTLVKKHRLTTILALQNEISAAEKGKQSGIISIGYQHQYPQDAEKVLNEITKIYVRQNVERSSAEAKKSLDFLRGQLPKIKIDLEKSEALFNDFQMSKNSVNISLETQAILEQIVELETTLQNVELQRLEISLQFKRQHPTYQAVLSQIKSIEQKITKLSSEVRNLPETQQQLLSLMRDVEVGNEIYTLLLAKIQELDIVRAGTVGNVRVVDHAASDRTQPVKPIKPLIVIIATLLGGMLAVAIVLIQKAFNKGVENPSEIEAIGLPVYACVPYSQQQDNFDKLIKNKRAEGKDNTNNNQKFKLKGTANKTEKSREKSNVLAIVNPADLTIEALRNLRTSLHFAMIESDNNLLIISGPSPEVGKSFISANLAVILAESGKKVLLIDGDMRRGYLHKIMALKPEQGLSEYLSGQESLEDVIKNTTVVDFDVITRGSIPPNPSELLMHKNFSHLNDAVRAKYDIVIIDTPPVLAVTDAAIIGGYGGTLLLVARYGKNSVKEIVYTRQRLEQNGIDVKGVVFNGIMKKASNTYGYYGNYGNYGYYNYEYKSDK